MSISTAISIVGTTASGKSALALALARQDSRIVIINADSQQIYQGMIIGTGAPSDADRTQAPHYLYNFHPPTEPYDVGKYLKDVGATLAHLHPTQIPVFVGGTGFYHRGLWQGLPEIPSDRVIRAELEHEWQEKGASALYDELTRQDPIASERIHPHNRVRLLRALEVIRVSGRPFSSFKEERAPIAALDGTRWIKLGIDVPRQALYEAIDRRVEAMFAAGLVDEVKTLLHRFGKCWALDRCLGYKQVLDHLSGEYELSTAKALTQKLTRHYAKRQMTWFRQEPDIEWATLDTYLEGNQLISL